MATSERGKLLKKGKAILADLYQLALESTSLPKEDYKWFKERLGPHIDNLSIKMADLKEPE